MRLLRPDAGLAVLLATSQALAASTTCYVAEIESNGVGVPVQTCVPITGGADSNDGVKTTTNAAGKTILSGASGVATVPKGLTTPTTIKLRSETFIFRPSPKPQSHSALTTTNAVGKTIISNGKGEFTIPTGLTKPTVLTASDGKKLTYTPKSRSTAADDRAETTVNSAKQTIISDSEGVLTIPTGRTKPFVVTEPNGEKITFHPHTAATTESSHKGSRLGDQTTGTSAKQTTGTSAAGFLIPITTPVTAPLPAKTGAKIPCKMWFFSLCLNWEDVHVGGWNIDLPPGIYPPGPPPPFTSAPGLKIDFEDNPPPWPKYTIGPDNTPKFPTNPNDNPDNECETKTAKYCATTTSYGVSTSGTVTRTTQSKVLSTCGTLTGCGATGTSTAATTTSTCGSGGERDSCPSATTYPYVIYPKDGANSQQVDQIATQLKAFVSDASKLEASQTKHFGLNYWRLPLNDSAPDDVRRIAGVSSVDAECDPNCTDDHKCIVCYDPTISTVYQDPAQPQLQFLSWPSTRASPLNSRYYFDESNGEGSRVYILDTGANMDNPEFANHRLLSRSHNIRWLFVNQDYDGRTHMDDSYNLLDQSKASGRKKAHGTAMLSLVAGNTLGIAKRASVVVVRLPRRSSGPLAGSFTPADYIDGLSIINEDIFVNGPPLPSQDISAVVMLAQAYHREAFYRRNPRTGDLIEDANNRPIDDGQGWKNQCKRLIESLATTNRALAVTGLGNDPGTADGFYPASFAASTEANPLKTLLVAGAIKSDGGSARYANDRANIGIPHVFAPGVDISAADGQPTQIQAGQPYKNSEGNSDAAAYTAGLAAYFMTLARNGHLPNSDGIQITPTGIMNYIIRQAWIRPGANGQQLPGIWNGVSQNQAKNSCPWNPLIGVNNRLRGRAGGSCPARSNSNSDGQQAGSAVASILGGASSISASAAAASSAGQEAGGAIASILGGASTITTATRSSNNAQPTSTTPLKKQPRVCVTAPLSHGQISAVRQDDYAARFCDGAADVSESIHPPGGDATSGMTATVADPFGTKYTFMIQWVPECVTTQPQQNVRLPVADDHSTGCSTLMRDNFQCPDNDGTGGSTQVGCVKYTFVGGPVSAADCKGCTKVDLPAPSADVPPPNTESGDIVA